MLPDDRSPESETLFQPPPTHKPAPVNDPEATLFAPSTAREPSTPGAPPAGASPDQRFADYVLEGELGRGGMGVVYKAYEPKLGRRVALKMILSGTLSGESELVRFRAEASAAARLQHPNIVKVHRIDVHEGMHFFSMDFIDGPSLAHKVSGGPLSPRAAARYALVVAQAIQHAHDNGILHRDLKPANVLLDEKGEPHVTDFGLAKHLSNNDGPTVTGSVLGTPAYMAPEQARGEKALTPATDVYGLGAMLYELLTARPPFRAETPLETMMQVLEIDPAPPSLLNPRVERDLETICLKCLSKDPRDRYASATELADDLRRFLDNESINARSLNVLDYVGRVLERSQFDVEFEPYGNLLLLFAAIVGSAHVAQHFLLSNDAPQWMVGLAHGTQFMLMLGAFWLARPRGVVPRTKAERLLWSVWVGYILACVMVGALVRLLFDPQGVHKKAIFAINSVLSGLAYFVLGSSYWGMLYAIAAAFFVLAFVMCLDLYWAPLEYAAAWSITLCLIGLHLRRLGAKQRQNEANRQPPK